MDGFEFPALPEDAAPLPGKAVVVMHEMIMKRAKDTGKLVTLVATGCLSNVALLLVLFPEIKSVLSKIVLMGGYVPSVPPARRRTLPPFVFLSKYYAFAHRQHTDVVAPRSALGVGNTGPGLS